VTERDPLITDCYCQPVLIDTQLNGLPEDRRWQRKHVAGISELNSCKVVLTEGDFMCVRTYVCVCVCTYVRTYVCILVCVCVYVCMYVCIYVCLKILRSADHSLAVTAQHSICSNTYSQRKTNCCLPGHSTVFCCALQGNCCCLFWE